MSKPSLCSNCLASEAVNEDFESIADPELDFASPQRRANSEFLHEAPVVHVSKLKKRKTVEGRKMLNNYIVLDLIGEGSYSKVKLCCHNIDHTYYALKILDRCRLKTFGIGKTSAINKIYREIAILKKLRHPNIIALQEVIDDPRSNKIYLVLEYASYGPLLSMSSCGSVLPDEDGLCTIPEGRCKTIARDLISALACAHENGIAHRDIKPENILVSKTGEMKLADFGVSSFLSEASSESCEGTIAFLPPELLRVDDATPSSTLDLLKADVWALGVSVLVMCSGRLPWGRAKTATDLLALFHRTSISSIISQELEDSDISDDLRDFLECTIHVDVEKRLSIFEAAAHPWITGASSSVPTRMVPHNLSSSIELDALDVRNAVSTATIKIASKKEVRQLPPIPSPHRIYFRSVPWESELYFRRSSGSHSADSPSNFVLNKNSFAFDDSVVLSLSPVGGTGDEANFSSLVHEYHERHLMMHLQLTPHARPSVLDTPQNEPPSSESPALADSFALPPPFAPAPCRRAQHRQLPSHRAFSQPCIHRWFARRVMLMGAEADAKCESLSQISPEVLSAHLSGSLVASRREPWQSDALRGEKNSES